MDQQPNNRDVPMEVSKNELKKGGPEEDDANRSHTRNSAKNDALLLEDIERQLPNKTLFDEVETALLTAFLMFCLPDLRSMAKEGVLQGDPETIRRIIDMPCTVADILAILETNKELLTSERLKDEERADMYHDALDLKPFKLDNETKQKAVESIRLLVFDDANEEEEIVYCISVSPIAKLINVTFRGSVTKKDFRQDAKALLSSIPNPVDPSGHHLGVHLGFAEYLYGEKKVKNAIFIPKWAGGGRETVCTGSKKKKEIILEQVRALVAEHPDCRVRVAGHSLGGALATLFAFEAAADNQIPKPVTCITSGSPKVGNIDFLQMFESLERENKLRCLHVVNDRDPVTLSPPIGALNPIHAMFFQRRRFRHVGLRLKLREHGYVITFPPKAKSYFGILCCDMMQIGRACGFIIVLIPTVLICLQACFIIAIPGLIFFSYRALRTSRKHHTQLKYYYRLQDNEQQLRKLTIETLNEERWARPGYKIAVLDVYRGRYCCGLVKR